LVSDQTDFRQIDSSVAMLTGEAAGQQVEHQDKHLARAVSKPWSDVPGVAEDPTYYERPMLKEPVWIWAVPLYFYVGGLSGAALTMAAAAQLLDGRRLWRFVRDCRWIGGIGGGIGSALLIADLGKPSRFLNMMRVFRPTSPMSIGAWVLAGAAPFGLGTALWSHNPGFRGRAADLVGLAGGALGMPLAGYTAVLISNSAIPVWQGARRAMPFLFISSSMASLASFYQIIGVPRTARTTLTIFGTAGRVAEIAALKAVEKEAAKVERVARPLRRGASGIVLTIAGALNAASLILSLWPGRSRKRQLAAGILGTAGSIALRYGIYYAGRASAQDPRASFHQQRQGYGARELKQAVYHG
jgi:formate-dependent nitrite reductase membrane component NrfD